MNRENVFEQQARQILAYLKSSVRYDENFLPRPFFVELTGPPSSGKTTIIKELDSFFRHHGFRVLKPQEGAEVIRHIPRSTPLYNIRTGLYALNILIDESMGHLYDIIIFERCAFDAICWMQYWLEKGKLSLEERDLIQKFFLSRFWINKIDAAYFLICDPEVAMKRELRIALSQKLGDTTNPKTIETLVSRYRSAFEILSPEYKQLRLMDTTNIDEQVMIETIAQEILNIFEKKTKEGEKIG
ncbi:MAG: hypothetical protein HYW79_01475 [Parcubacteria group bacterium]|nr:hypothetical protein [Parcubacteria group bacterium]